ncbi:Retrovirus-related Pol polyprotein from transposon TNT 1-94 [Senna tora]|uniref:Retrovirus-related Pol polyprotein from transposon TNT 1-94 n=1 Tax=Senna tora TaxID=362788 RepID=A0A835CHU6_9FABA|nr:Retrovirus-related Pol polyprotein from transposon TNT 1-94 [Senna tora]
MPGSPDMNGVAERMNRKLLDMVRVYNPHEKKLDPRTIFVYFVGHAERSKGYKFYCPTHTLKFVESRNAKFLENDTFSGSDQFHDLVNENDHELGNYVLAGDVKDDRSHLFFTIILQEKADASKCSKAVVLVILSYHGAQQLLVILRLLEDGESFPPGA